MHVAISCLFVLPLAFAWLGCFCLARELAFKKRIDPDWRLSWIVASVAFGLILTLIVEISSVAHALNRTVVASLWAGVNAALYVAVWRLRSRRPQASETRTFGSWFRLCPWDAKCLLGLTVSLIGFLFFVALLTPTSNADSRTYHLPRMIYWMQQGSIDHFQTDDLRQLEFGPFSSFAMTNLFLLWGNDRLLNLVQWFAMLSSVVLVTWLVKQLDLFVRGSSGDPVFEARRTAFAALLAATLPIGIVESITTQNDYTTAFWVLCLFAFAVLLAREPENAWYLAGAGLSAGLGALTKATTYMYAGPLILLGAPWFFLRGSSRSDAVQQESSGSRPRSWGLRLRFAFLFTGCFFALNAPHLLRNYMLFGSPLGSPEIMAMERNDRITPMVAASNAIRTLVLHTSTPVSWVTERFNAGVAFLHQLTGKDLNDPATTFRYCRFTFPDRFLVSDSWASCAVHLALCMVAGLIVLLRPRQNAAIVSYAAAVILSVVFFCAFLKWQAWHTRIQLAWFLILAPAVAILICQYFPRWAVQVTGALLFWFATCTVAMNTSRPVFKAEFRLLAREEKYYGLDDHGRNLAYQKLAASIVESKCRNIGLKADSCEAEYPLWMMLKNRGFEGRIDRCFVENVSARIPSSAPRPDMIISIFNVFPEAVSNAYPRLEQFADLTALWPDKPLYAGKPR